MRCRPGLFDVEERLKRLSNLGHQLPAFAAAVELKACCCPGDRMCSTLWARSPLSIFEISSTPSSSSSWRFMLSGASLKLASTARDQVHRCRSLCRSIASGQGPPLALLACPKPP